MILLADDHGLFRESIKHWLEGLTPDYRIETATSYAEVIAVLEGDIKPRLILLDLCMPGMDGVDSIHDIHAQWPDIPILVVSAHDNPLLIRACIDAGASGFVPKSGKGEEMLEAIGQILAGHSHIPPGIMALAMPKLSRQQLKILRLLAKGRSNREIADHIHLSEGTIRQYISDILVKLDVGNRTQAGNIARNMLGLNN